MDYFPLFIDATIGNTFRDLQMDSIYSCWIIEQYNRQRNQQQKQTFQLIIYEKSVIAECILSLQNPKLKETEPFTSLLNVLLKIEDRMTEQGFAVTPVTSRKIKKFNFSVLSEQSQEQVFEQKIKIINLN